MKAVKDAHVKFQAEHVGNIYMLQNSKVIIGRLQLSVTSSSEIVEQSDTTVLSSDV